ncbi:glycosyltransferase family 2 protein [Blastococcus goldschmidtiae]|uniref:Glycosyltransferase n=1 Tax=Blastococcus goldschmidtiae TaxID=3075546 RepID=A0ABU2K8E1_9ACTN|nr:glycosyltransferase [Blastococcus sp. DSM 46792]MDT0276449.1 glycosyltransferase [Blastococcus sp. DSM 46792]
MGFSSGDRPSPPRVGVVVATRNRRESLLRSLARLDAPGGAPITVVDNGSTDGTPAAVRAAHPRVTVRELGRNQGAVARNVGVAMSATPYVAFSDDDSWWAPGALERAADVLDAHPGVAALVGRVRLAADGSEDAVSRKMARAPIGRRAGAPGPDVLGFPACAAVVRREAFLAVGGFSPLLFFGGEESLLSLDLAAAGWQQVYVEDVVAWHDPAGPATVAPARWALQTRNDLLVAWLRRPLPTAAWDTARLAARALRDPSARRALAGLLRRLPAAVRARRAVPREVEDGFSAAHRPLPRLSSAAAG